MKLKLLFFLVAEGNFSLQGIIPTYPRLPWFFHYFFSYGLNIGLGNIHYTLLSYHINIPKYNLLYNAFLCGHVKPKKLGKTNISTVRERFIFKTIFICSYWKSSNFNSLKFSTCNTNYILL